MRVAQEKQPVIAETDGVLLLQSQRCWSIHEWTICEAEVERIPPGKANWCTDTPSHIRTEVCRTCVRSQVSVRILLTRSMQGMFGASVSELYLLIKLQQRGQYRNSGN